MLHLDTCDDLWLLDLGDGENRLSPSWIDTALALLDHAATRAPELMITGSRVGGNHAQSLGVVTQAVDEQAVRDVAVAHVLARGGKPEGAVGRIKQDLYAPALTLLQHTAPALA